MRGRCIHDFSGRLYPTTGSRRILDYFAPVRKTIFTPVRTTNFNNAKLDYCIAQCPKRFPSTAPEEVPRGSRPLCDTVLEEVPRGSRPL